MTITAKYEGVCRKCGRKIRVGEKIEWEKGKGSQHAQCTGKPEPILNSRPPQASVPGDTDLSAAAAKHGRKAVDGAKLASFSRQVHRGEHCLAIGAVERVRGKYYVVLGRTRPEYLSRDWLDDMDDFSRQPGLWYEWQGVEVEPTEEETAADQAKADAKAEEARKAARRKEIEGLVRRVENATDHRLPQGLEDCWGRRAMAGHDVLLSDGKEIVAYSQSSYDDDWYTWVLHDPALAAEAAALKTTIGHR